MSPVRNSVKKKLDLYRIFDTVVHLSELSRQRGGDSFILHFRPERSRCPLCWASLEYYKTTRARSFRTLRYGELWFRETQVRCPSHPYHPEDGSPFLHGSSFLRSLVPPGSSVGYDVIVEIGKQRFLEFRQVEEVVEALERHQVTLSTSSVSRWADFFLAAVECLHFTKMRKLKILIKNNGGYLLHIDATTECKSDTVFVCIDRILGVVLLSEKIPSESSEEVERALKVLKRNIGVPLAIMRDMGKAMGGGVQNVFPEVPDRICQFHFLRDIGRDLLSDLHVRVGHQLVRQKINQDLRRMKRQMEASTPVESVKKTFQVLQNITEVDQLPGSVFREHEGVFTLRLIDWILDYAKDGQGLGFPFDTPRLFFYARLNRVRLRLARYRKRHPKTMKACSWLGRLEQILERITEPSLRAEVRELRSINRRFQYLRSVLNFQITTKAPLAETMSMGTLKEVRAYNRRLLAFTKQLLAERRKGTISETDEVILKHFEKYQFNLPIPEVLAEILLLAKLDRTNNIQESLFRDIKRGQRRQVGKKDISREFARYGPYLPLMKNLTNEKYTAAVIGKIEDLPIRISRLDPAQIEHYRQKLQESRRGKFHRYLKDIDAMGMLPGK